MTRSIQRPAAGWLTIMLAAVCLAGAGLVAASSSAFALPRFSLLYGTRCSGCHHSPQGGGIRNPLGYSVMSEVSAFTPDSISLAWLRGESRLDPFDGVVEFGLDMRLQVAKLGRPPNDERKVIPMQLAPSIAIVPADFLSIYATYNAGPLRYPGQTSFDVAVQVQPGIETPSIRAGYIQPSIGQRYDDHTMFTRRDVAGSGAPIIAPNYNEIGAELTYEGLHWLTVNAGVFSARNLAKAEPVDPDKPSILGRVTLWPQWLDEDINGQIGASAYVNGDFRMINAFAGLGLADQATLFAEVMTSRNANDRTVRNVSVAAGYQPEPWVSFNGRYEHGITETAAGAKSNADAFVLGVEFFPLPFIELRPEYRYIRTESYILGQYSFQLHAFY